MKKMASSSASPNLHSYCGQLANTSGNSTIMKNNADGFNRNTIAIIPYNVMKGLAVAQTAHQVARASRRRILARCYGSVRARKQTGALRCIEGNGKISIGCANTTQLVRFRIKLDFEPNFSLIFSLIEQRSERERDVSVVLFDCTRALGCSISRTVSR